ncbi:type II toxin-antitoxin system RelE/ParE family toxin [Shinella sp. BYT-45]|uniref:type II toxin-antitoxin system RelE/ParE family toxin n=1 Tax=Shinella sp. BYT-45 TaxID=3377377 RepID=UPI0039811212
MLYRVQFAPEARDDLLRLYDFVAERAGASRAIAYLSRIEAFCLGFERFPQRGIARDDIFPGLRVVGFEKRVTLAFHIVGDTVVFDRVLYAGRQFPAEDDMS